MPMSSELLFVSSNKHKFTEARQILSKYGIKLKFRRLKLVEIQSESVLKIARHKALAAYQVCRRPVIIEDDALFIDSLSGFPGPYSSYVYDTIGNSGIIRLVGKKRQARFCAVISYCNGGKKTWQFVGIVKGKISKKPRGSGWGYDPIFIPQNSQQTYGMMKQKNMVSHRYAALKKFAAWYTKYYCK